MHILVINAGSSSLKYQLFALPAEAPLCRGQIERIGTAGSSIRHQTGADQSAQVIEFDEIIANHAAGFGRVLALLTDPVTGVISTPDAIDAVGHRVVHGGERFAGATLVTPAVKETIRALFPLAPLHNPINYACIELAQMTFPRARQVAVFDTAFHQTMPDYAFRYALPTELYQQEAIRVYGFHGTSHQYVSQQAMAWLGKPDAKLISIHLGNGSSITAVDGGKSIDTSMGFSPLSGLVMGTRSGDVDPAVILHLITRGYSPEAVNNLLNKQSGMQGLTGFSDMRDIRKALAAGDPAAALACELYAYRVKKYIGAYAAILNGVDAILFTGGIGENDRVMRETICTHLNFLGIVLDLTENSAPARTIRAVSTTDSRVTVLVVPTNEELEIAWQSYAVLAG
ncbi:acetate/propionate family kinase [Spirosoma arcticum]